MGYAIAPSCQIPGLAAMYESVFGPDRVDGTFVEVGAFDGETVSNTSGLADAGWRGVYIEPVEEYARECAERHRRNPRVTIVQCAVGRENAMTQLHVCGFLSTTKHDTAEAYGAIDWAKWAHGSHVVGVKQHTLDLLLRLSRIPPRFDLLVVDVEGSELDVFQSFDLGQWRPRMLIVEIEDHHESFQAFPELTRRSRAVRRLITRHGYRELYRDQINTVFVSTRRSRKR